MLRHPVVLTTIEEDFKRIGLLDEANDEKSQDEMDDKEKHAKKAAAAKSAPEEKKEGEEDLDEVRSSRLKRHTSGERLKWRRAKKKGKAKAAGRKYRKKSTVKRMLKRHRLRAKKLRHGKAAGRRRLTFGNDTISNMLEEVQEIVSGIDTERVEHTVKAFANVAIIAEMLSRAFAKFEAEAEGEDKDTLAEAAKFFSEMAEEASEIAKGLNEGPGEDEEFDLEEIGEVFKGHMSDLLNGLDMYADITEDDDLGETVKGASEDGHDAEDDDEDEGDDEKKSPFGKSKKETKK
jgi:hypothetical protein